MGHVLRDADEDLDRHKGKGMEVIPEAAVDAAGACTGQPRVSLDAHGEMLESIAKDLPRAAPSTREFAWKFAK